MNELEIRPLGLGSVAEIVPLRFADDRGFFSEVWRADKLASAGINVCFVQDNHSYSAKSGVLRGLHFQEPPAAQDKLVRVVRGSIFDVAVDIQPSSATFGQWVGVRLSASEWNQLFVPKGFAHGFVTLEENCEVLYKTSAYFAPGLDRCVRFDDPAIGIEWPVEISDITLSAKDQAAPLLSEIHSGF